MSIDDKINRFFLRNLPDIKDSNPVLFSLLWGLLAVCLLFIPLLLVAGVVILAIKTLGVAGVPVAMFLFFVVVIAIAVHSDLKAGRI